MNIYARIDLACMRMLNRFRLFRLKMLGAQIGKGVQIFGRIIVLGDARNLRIGDYCTINEGVMIVARVKVSIGAYCRLSPYVQIHTGALNLDHWQTDGIAPPPQQGRRHSWAEVCIGDHVWCASGSIITKGVTIGRGSVVGASSVVTRNLPENVFAAGIPCRVIRELKA
jgi:maltose O-acetyltransferase